MTIWMAPTARMMVATTMRLNMRMGNGQRTLTGEKEERPSSLSDLTPRLRFARNWH